MLSRVKPAVGGDSAVSSSEKKRKTKSRKIPRLEDYLSQRDYLGALTLLEFQRNGGAAEENTDLWIGYCAFHLGDHKRSMEEYRSLTLRPDCPDEVWVFLGCALFFLGLYKEAEEVALKGPKSQLQNRLLFHLAHKFGDEKKLMGFHQNLEDVTEDQLSLASIHYMRSHYQEAIDIYKRILLQNREFLALNVYVALCYYKLDYYDVSQEVLAVYLQNVPDSTIALNLKACNHFRLYNGKAAEAELKNLIDISSSSFEFAKELIRHNLVVFRGGEGALQVLPPLIDVISEARLNLVIYYLRQDDVQEAYNLIKDLEPTTPQVGSPPDTDQKALLRLSHGVVPDCHGVTQNGSGSSSVTSPALVLVETPNESVCGGPVVSTKMIGLVSLHLHPYRTICRNCVRMFKLHGMDYHRTPSGTSTAPYRDVWRVGLANTAARRHTERQTSEYILKGVVNAALEYILKGVVNAALGQEIGSRDHLKIAQQFFQLVGGSASECDTIPGRQCMASCFFLLKQFEDVLIYLNSVKSYFYTDDTFNFNYAQAKAALGSYKEAEEVFLLIQSEKIKNDYVYLSWLARCYIMNQKARLAWELYLKMETSSDSFSLLQLIANDCYKMGQFYYAAKAFDVLERLDPNPEYWEGKRGACVGIFQLILAGREPRESLKEVLPMLRSTGNPQVEYIIRIMKKWAKDNRVAL
ncbi:hypothetical protein NFI96_011220 [Prochilodus magdalenae]|nr:hypothetical protein NFI96_011220 [Prochilodus magdalenae]